MCVQLEFGKVYKVRLLPPKELSEVIDRDLLLDGLGRVRIWYSEYFGAVGYLTLHLKDRPNRCIVEWPEGLGGDGEHWRYPVKAFKVLGEVDLSAVDGLELARYIIF